MHELALAAAVIDIAGTHAAGRRVTGVHVKVGHLRQVVPSALEFCFELTTAGTPMAGARLEIDQVPAAGACRGCGRESELDGFPLACSACGSLDVEVIRGEELLVDSLELEDEVVMSG
jgi:hydrogenase nickel incorporation protein HypA/HybF